MTYRLTASYHHPENKDALVTHYRDVHSQIAAKLPDLRSFTWGVCETPDGSQPAHALIAVLDWDTAEAAQAALGSDVGKEAIADLDNFAQAGVDLEFQELTKTV